MATTEPGSCQLRGLSKLTLARACPPVCPRKGEGRAFARPGRRLRRRCTGRRCCGARMGSQRAVQCDGGRRRARIALEGSRRRRDHCGAARRDAAPGGMWRKASPRAFSLRGTTRPGGRSGVAGRRRGVLDRRRLVLRGGSRLGGDAEANDAQGVDRRTCRRSPAGPAWPAG